MIFKIKKIHLLLKKNNIISTLREEIDLTEVINLEFTKLFNK